MRTNYRLVMMTVGIVSLISAAIGLSAEPVTQPATTQPITAGRDTPAGAMTVYEHAIDIGDVATVADSFNSMPASASQAIAKELILSARFNKAMERHCGHAALVKLCDECRMEPDLADVKYTNDMWTITLGPPDQAVGNWEPGKKGARTGFMQRAPDGIWRMGRYVSPEVRRRATTRALAARARLGLTSQPINPRTTMADQMIVRLQRAIDGMESGKLTSEQDVERALYPEGTPMEQSRRAEQEEKESSKKQEEEFEKRILAAHFDSSTLEGSIGMFAQAMLRRDADGMANLMFVAGAADNSYAMASAKRLLAIGDFAKAMADHIGSKGRDLSISFRLDRDAAFVPSLAWDQPREHGDEGMISRGGNGEVAAWYRKVGGVWKQEIKLHVPQSQKLESHTKDVEDDTSVLQRITTDINAGKLKSDDQVRDALGNSGLNCFSDPTFTLDFENVNPNVEKSHNRPKDAPAPSDPKSPAGAMNRFIRAVQSGDEATVRDCLWVPNDKTGGAGGAMAHDYVVGARFVRALQKDTPPWDPNYFCHNCCVIQPESLRDYSEDEWRIDPTHADIAVSNGAYIARPDVPNNSNHPSFTMVHEWTPMMHRGGDGVWRLGPWYPQSGHQLVMQSAMLAEKDKVLDKAAADLNADKVRTIDDLSNAVLPQLETIGATPITTMRP